MHDSPAILLARSGQYCKQREAIRQWYCQQHDNWSTIDGERSQWWVWNEVRSKALHTAVQIQQYMDRITGGKELTCIHIYLLCAHCDTCVVHYYSKCLHVCAWRYIYMYTCTCN